MHPVPLFLRSMPIHSRLFRTLIMQSSVMNVPATLSAGAWWATGFPTLACIWSWMTLRVACLACMHRFRDGIALPCMQDVPVGPPPACRPRARRRTLPVAGRRASCRSRAPLPPWRRRPTASPFRRVRVFRFGTVGCAWFWVPGAPAGGGWESCLTFDLGRGDTFSLRYIY